MSHSTRVRGLKWHQHFIGDAQLLSHSTRVRGLKFFWCYICDAGSDVALYTSAWIEIANSCSLNGRYGVALYTSAWIEILTSALQKT